MFVIERTGKVPVYEQIYHFIKREIESGELLPGDRLLSVRRFAEIYGVSKITVEQSYAQLAAEGYIQAHNRAPYEVLPIYELKEGASYRETSLFREKKEDSFLGNIETGQESSERVLYDFATSAMDPEGFDSKKWRRHVNAVLRNPDRLLGYGEENGEWALREEIARYIHASRGVVCNPKQVIIGSGTQILMQHIAELIKKYKNKSISVAIGEEAMRQMLFWGTDAKLVSINKKEMADVLYITPSHMNYHGGILSIADRLAVLDWANRKDAYIVEDDYDSELRYVGRPIPAMQGLDTKGRVIYVGSVSKVLPPSVRISYMVLPEMLYAYYAKEWKAYRQTASVLEQLALASYMGSGEWGRQIRRLRKHYQEKSKYMVALLKEAFGDRASFRAPEGGLYVEMRFYTNIPGDRLLEKIKRGGCRVRYVGDEQGHPVFLLSLSAIPTKALRQAIRVLAKHFE